MKLHFRKLHESAKAPIKGSTHAAAYDLTCIAVDHGFGDTQEHTRYHTGLAFAIPEGHVGLIFPRSSVFKSGLMLANAVGVIDPDYRGEVTAVFRNFGEIDGGYVPGERCCQLMILPVPQIDFEEVASLQPTERGDGGYGSTGR